MKKLEILFIKTNSINLVNNYTTDTSTNEYFNDTKGINTSREVLNSERNLTPNLSVLHTTQQRDINAVDVVDCKYSFIIIY